MERRVVVLGFVILLAVGAVASGEPCLQLDEGSSGGGRVDAASAMSATPIIVCPNGDASIDGALAGRLAESRVTVTSVDGDWLFTDSGVSEPIDMWNERSANQPVSVWLSQTDCRRADGVTAAIGDVSVLVLFEPPELIVPNTTRYRQIVVVTSDAVLADQFSAVAELSRASGFGDNGFIVLNGCAGRNPDVERTVVTLLASSDR
ncbi:MAG: hypothetical protein ACOC2N_04625 [Spirochaetota bacterium]